MFRGRKKDTLPTASIPTTSLYSSYSPYSSNNGTDGSGRGIRMEAPIVRAWKNSTNYTKRTYYVCIFNLFLIYWGYRHMAYSSASLWLNCHAVECTLQITPPGGRKTTKLQISRRQLVQTQAIKVDKDGGFVRIDTGPPMHHYSADARKKKRKNSGGPDVDGYWDSYTVILRPPIESHNNGDGNGDGDSDSEANDESVQYEVDLSPLQPFTHQEEGTDNRVLVMRQFNVGQTKRRTRTMTSKIDSYIQQRRHQLIIKENANVSWQGVLSMVFGLFFLLLTFLVGQFWDEPNPTGGPGTRRKMAASKKKMKTVGAGKYH